MNKRAALLMAILLFISCAAFPGARAETPALDWQKLFSGGKDRLFLFGRDDPALLPIAGKHAFAVLGYALKDGKMTQELKGRCDAAAAAAKAFPDSILVCSGGASGDNNPEGRTEAGLMKDYLTEVCGVAPERVFIDEQAADTAENAVNTFAILREQGVEAVTLVTSSYHLARAETLYRAVAARYRETFGYNVDFAGNFCLDIEPSDDLYLFDALTAMVQLAGILRLPGE